MVVNIWWKVAQGCLFVDDEGQKNKYLKQVKLFSRLSWT